MIVIFRCVFFLVAQISYFCSYSCPISVGDISVCRCLNLYFQVAFKWIKTEVSTNIFGGWCFNHCFSNGMVLVGISGTSVLGKWFTVHLFYRGSVLDLQMRMGNHQKPSYFIPPNLGVSVPVDGPAKSCTS